MESYLISRDRRPTRAWPASCLTTIAAVACCIAVTCCPAAARGAGPNQAQAIPAKAAVVAFLDAVKRGDDDAARGLLSRVARAKTEELAMSIAPPVADTATYAVQDCEIVSEAGDLAHVGTVWTDVSADGTRSTENVVWVVRLDPEGWRVVGMAMRVFDDLPPLLLNFEDPEDMIAKQEMVAAEFEKRARRQAESQPAASRTARDPGGPPGSRQ